jgi:hypothetical protein
VYRDSVARHGESNGLMSGGNRQLEQYAAEHAAAPARTTEPAPGIAAAPAPPADGSPPPSAPAPTPASTSRASSTVAGRVLAPVAKPSSRSGRSATKASLALSIISAAAAGLFVTGFARREGAL